MAYVLVNEAGRTFRGRHELNYARVCSSAGDGRVLQTVPLNVAECWPSVRILRMIAERVTRPRLTAGARWSGDDVWRLRMWDSDFWRRESAILL